MNINATIFGQLATFAILIWFVMKYVWPPIVGLMDSRAKRIADGLAAAERGRHELELASHRSGDVLREARQKATEIITQAEHRAGQIVEEAKTQARTEGERIKASAHAEAQQEYARAREGLRQRVADLAVAGAEKILRREVDAEIHSEFLAELQTKI